MNANWFEQLAVMALAMPPWPDPRFPPSPYYRFLRLLAQNVKPRLSVELGLCGGGGSFHLAIGWSGGHVVGVESSEGDDHLKANWAHMDATLPNFTRWHGDSVASARPIHEAHGDVDVLFIDTTHTYEQTMLEWISWRPFFAGRYVVCLDDLHRPGMDRFWEWVPCDKVRLDALHPNADPREGGGFGVAWGRWEPSWR